MSRYFRLAHLKEPPFVSGGDWVTPQQQIGLLGNTGHSTGPHLHMDAVTRFQTNWNLYYQIPFSCYVNTLPWAKLAFPHEEMYVTSRHSWKHRGVDINCPNDLGKPVFSPVNGRVVYVDKLGKTDWGFFLVIEEDMTQPTI